MKKLNFALYIVLFMALLGSMGIVNLAQAEFNMNILSDANYWLLTITSSLSYFGAFILATLTVRDKKIMTDQDFLSTNNDIREINNRGVDSDFPDFISGFNKKEKIKTWIEDINYKLSVHSKKIPKSVLSELKLKEEEQSSRTRKWINKRDDLKLKTTSKWIEENIDYTFIRYPMVTASEVLTGYEKPQNKRKIDNRVALHILRDRWFYVMMNVISNAFFASLLITGENWTTESTMRLIIMITGVLLNVVFGASYGSSLFGKIDLTNVTTRKIILVDYLANKSVTR